MKNVQKKGLAALLSLCLMLSLIPYSAFAEGGGGEPGAASALAQQELRWSAEPKTTLVYLDRDNISAINDSSY